MIDVLSQLSAAQALTATALSTNVYDLGANTPARQIGDGRPVGVCFAVIVAADFTTTDETYEFQIQQSASANMGTPTTISKMAIVATILTLGFTFEMWIPGGYPTQRFIAVNYVLAGTTPLLTVSAWVAPQFMGGVKPQTYKKAYTITG